MTKTILITGANRGIGLEIAKLAHQKGYEVLGTARDPSKATELSAIAKKVFKLDVSSEESISSFAKQLGDIQIDFLVNNAGVYIRAPLEQISAENMVQEYLTNTVGPLLLSRALLPNLRKTQMPRIANLTSRMGSIADNTSGGSYGYRASKAALNAVFKSWSHDVKDVPAINVHPGFIKTDMTGGRGDTSPEECSKKLWLIFDSFLNEPDSKYKSGMFLHRDGFELPW